MPTDSDRQAACERIATAMGWKKLSPRDIRWRQLEDDEHATRLRWANPVDVAFVSPPDFFADPVAFMALWEWLRTKKHWEVGINSCWSDPVDVHIADSECHRCGVIANMFDDNVMVALALAADAAIKEAERGK